MKHKKLSLDKLNVVRLNNTQNIFGGGMTKNDGDTAGIGGESTPTQYNPNNDNANTILGADSISATGPRSGRSSIRCVPVSPIGG